MLGTYPGILVLLHLIRENAAAHYDVTARGEVGLDLLHVFAIDNCYWRRAIIDRGQKIFWASVTDNK